MYIASAVYCTEALENLALEPVLKITSHRSLSLRLLILAFSQKYISSFGGDERDARKWMPGYRKACELFSDLQLDHNAF